MGELSGTVLGHRKKLVFRKARTFCPNLDCPKITSTWPHSFSRSQTH